MRKTKVLKTGLAFFLPIFVLFTACNARTDSSQKTIVSETEVDLRTRLFGKQLSNDDICTEYMLFQALLKQVQYRVCRTH